MLFASSQAPGRLWLRPAVVALLALHVALAASGVLGRSVTSDETAHIAAGCAYWQFDDYRLQPENGNLPQRWGALPVLAVGGRLHPAEQPNEWRASMVWVIAQHFLFESGLDTDYALLLARCAMLAWSAAAGLLVFAWARALAGNAAGLGALAFFAVSPTSLAHGPLVTSDMCAAFFLLAGTAAIWRVCVRPGWWRALLAGAVIGLAFMAKLSAVFLAPTALLIGTAALGIHLRQRGLLRTLGFFVALVAVAGATALAVIWTFYGWRYAAAAPGLPALASFYLPWDRVLASHGWLAAMVETARHFRLFPEAFLYGLSFVAFFSTERGAFLLGRYSVTGWWWFFPFAFFVKSTLGELALALLACWRTAPRLWAARGRDRFRALVENPVFPLLVFTLVFGAFTLASHLNIGHRHILPLYLVLFILGGACFSRTAPRWMRIAASLALVASAVETAANFPNYLAFFNRAAGGPENGWRLLADSSIDWGQDVAPLARWVKAHRQPGEHVYISFFGTADPDYEGLSATFLSPYFALGKPRRWIELEPGLYCVSATMLQDVYGPRPGLWTADLERDYQYLKAAARIHLARGDWNRDLPPIGFHAEHPLWLLDRLRFARLCQYLRVRKPDAVINHTQFVFRLSAHEIDVMVDRPFSEVAALIEQASRRSETKK